MSKHLIGKEYMNTLRIFFRAGAAVIIVGIFFAVGCKESSTDANKSNEVITADTSFVNALEITVRPITDSNAVAIAVLASAGKAISVASATYENMAVYKVQIQTGSLLMYLYVRISDGALVKDSDDDEHN